MACARLLLWLSVTPDPTPYGLAPLITFMDAPKKVERFYQVYNFKRNSKLTLPHVMCPSRALRSRIAVVRFYRPTVDPIFIFHAARCVWGEGLMDDAHPPRARTDVLKDGHRLSRGSFTWRAMPCELGKRKSDYMFFPSRERAPLLFHSNLGQL